MTLLSGAEIRWSSSASDFNAAKDTGIKRSAAGTIKVTDGGTGIGSVEALKLAAGTATAGTAPLKFTSGTHLTTPENGAVEYNGTHFYGTISGARKQLDSFGVLGVSEVTGTSQAAAVNSRYIANNAGLVTITLPSTAAVGDVISVRGKGAGGWKIAQNSGQTIHGATNSTTGVTGYIASSAQYDCVEVECITANTDFVISNSRGTITIA